ncbi:MAG: amino acid permease, partial [Candidatus Omnitrophica bacterium]|nr:amino acid permease [Candidatus Omnitrophota bacterium]
VIMYLRFGWVLGQVGLWETLIIVTLATSITFLTSLSISELATNMRVGGGGAYYIISRSLGLETGAAIGLPLFFAQAVGISFYVAGFSESVAPFFPDVPVHLLGIATLFILAILALFSADLALKLQFIILTLITASLFSFFFGHWQPPEVAQSPAPAIISHLPFWAVFAVFFPAVTGIEAGLSMSGDLKNPSKALPLGTLSAVIFSYCVYIAIPIFLTHLNIDKNTLITNSLIMKDVAKWDKLVYAGLWGAALSSAMGGLLGAPRTLQALSRDNVVPRWLGRTFGKQGDPRIATVISFFIAMLGIMLGDLNVIAPVLSMFFLTSYGLLNLSAALNGILNNASWRPKFRVHWVLPFLGFLGCVITMFMINPGATFIA